MNFSTHIRSEFDIFRLLNDAGYKIFTMNTKHIKLIFGLKLKQLRLGKGLSLSELAAKSNLSVSYLNEIESGKKYPKTDKISALAEALNTTYDRLVSLKLVKNLAPVAELLESNILEQLPLDHYGIDINKLITLMINSSLLSALIATFIETAQSSELSQNNFSRNALRIFKEFSDNHFEEYEAAVKCFTIENQIANKFKVEYKELKNLLENNYNYEVDETILNNYPELNEFRAVVVKNGRNKLLINNRLSDAQKAFVIGKELAYNYLGIKDRSYLYSNVRLNTFDHLVNYFKASYFSTALLINSELLIGEINKFFNEENWNSSIFLSLMNKFNTTPEIFFQRIISLSSKYFDLNRFFFYRINHEMGTDNFYLLNELKLNTPRNFSAHQFGEHLCRRWSSISMVREYEKLLSRNKNYSARVASITIAKFFESNDDYLCITVVQKGNLLKNQLSSLTIGFLIDNDLRQKIKFADDPKIPSVIVNETCERCRITECKERAAMPVEAVKFDKSEQTEKALQRLYSEV
jgi:transcriptional regulator with XRE-family HTH domain